MEHKKELFVDIILKMIITKSEVHNKKLLYTHI